MMKRCQLAAAIASVLLAVGLVSCGSHTRNTQGAQTQTPVIQNINPLTADDLVAAIAKSGLAVPNPHDVTQRDCPQIGCLQKVETDTVSIMKFPTPGRAQLYAGSINDRLLIEDVVMTFAPSLAPGQRPAYVSALKRAIE
jgi:hypothetical protein